MNIERNLVKDAVEVMDAVFHELIQPEIDQTILPSLIDKLVMASARLNAKLQNERAA